MILVISIVGAAAGDILHDTFGLPAFLGTAGIMILNYMMLFTLVTSGLTLSDVPGHEEDARLYLQEAQSWLEGRGGIYETCDALAGGWPEGAQYGYRENTRLLVLMMHALRSATDQDPFARVRRHHGDFVRKIERSFMAMTRPDMSLERIGDVNRI